MSKAVNQAEFVGPNMIAQGDTRNEVRVRLQDHTGAPIDITGKTVTWSGAQEDILAVPARQATVYPNGEVGIKFLSTDVMRRGALYLQFDVTWSAGVVETFPARNNLFLVIT